MVYLMHVLQPVNQSVVNLHHWHGRWLAPQDGAAPAAMVNSCAHGELGGACAAPQRSSKRQSRVPNLDSADAVDSVERLVKRRNKDLPLSLMRVCYASHTGARVQSWWEIIKQYMGIYGNHILAKLNNCSNVMVDQG